MDVKLPDGTILRGVPDGMSKADLVAKLKNNGYDTSGLEPKTTVAQDIKQGAGNFAAGLVRGAGSIGATLLSPIDIAKDAINGKGFSLESNRQRRSDMDAALSSMGAETDSLGYGAGKLTGEIAGTAGAGGAVANGVRMGAAVAGKAVPAAANTFLNAISSGGLTLGANAPTNALANILRRNGGGAVKVDVASG